MSLLRASSQLAKLATPFQLTAVRGMAGEGLKGFNEREHVMEDLFFSKEDERLFSKLLSKVKQQSKVVDKHSAEGTKAAEVSALKAIADKYKISQEDVEKLLTWKHTNY